MSVRSEIMKDVMGVTLAANKKHGPKFNRDVVEALAVVIVATASRAGQQSVECPASLIDEEAFALVQRLESVFGEIT